jgi:hypothetical protein
MQAEFRKKASYLPQEYWCYDLKKAAGHSAVMMPVPEAPSSAQHFSPEGIPIL